MQNKKTLTSTSGYNLVQTDVLAQSGDILRTSFEVEDPNEDAIGRFGSLLEAERFIKLLCHLN
ncbi:hypothetical protein [Colwellia psychrerythraea]|uniref:Uncharacterized protein n=1 Tax=Colwellia psychrerythraea TaxID=28229 RepID=A0A099KJ27_COLPS|nr:hypothetical protein [Colwellia psychrerythraea]KGJ90411.1 hypothetical protein GAB14E_3654 [Colwellia psychrerythraea]